VGGHELLLELPHAAGGVGAGAPSLSLLGGDCGVLAADSDCPWRAHRTAAELLPSFGPPMKKSARLNGTPRILFLILGCLPIFRFSFNFTFMSYIFLVRPQSPSVFPSRFLGPIPRSS
jgi:hypothetical protein